MNSTLKNNEYIVFQPDQVLTNDHLNQLFYYLDRQNRLTRNKLIGMGIVCGLELEVTMNAQSRISSIQTNKGCGITSQGYLIIEHKNKSYTHVVLYTPLQQPADLPFTCGTVPFYNPPFTADSKIYSLVTCEEYKTFLENPNAPKPPAPPCPPANGTTATTSGSGTQTATDANQPIPLSSMDWSDYAVVLFLEAKEKDLKNCDMQDCNNKGEKIVFHIHPLLVPKKFLQSNCTDKNKNNSKAPEIRLQRYNVPATDLSSGVNILNAFTTVTSQTLLSEVAGAYSFCSANYTNALQMTSDPFVNFQTTLNNLLNSVKGDLISAQYFYDYINELILAYYEFREVADRLNIQCCADECAFPLHLVLGAATKSTSVFSTDFLRTYFIYSPLFDDGEKSIEKLRFYFKRMEILAAQFQNGAFDLPSGIISFENNADRFIRPSIKITPSRYEQFPLSQRAIPYYYDPVDTSDTDNSLYKFWNFDKAIKGDEAFNLSYNANQYNSYDKIVNAPLRYDIEQYNFFRIEGHIGLPYKTALGQLLIQKQQYNLPFNVIALSAESLDPADVTLSDCYIKDLKTEYQARVIEFLCKLLLCIKPLIRIFAQAGDAKKTEKKQEVTLQTEKNDNDISAFIRNFQFGVSEYQPGDFVKSFNPQSNEIGDVYLNAIKSETFANPIDMNEATTKDLYINQSYSYSYNILDLTDKLFQTLLNTGFEDTDAPALEKQFKTLELNLNRLKNLLVQRESDNATFSEVSFDDCACDCLPCLFLDILWLLKQYLLRRKQYATDQLFANYFTKHTGAEHKAGVPKGGTFILVYSNTDINTKENNDPIDFRAVKANEIILRRNPVVIADFYIPYLCCSDCSPAIIVKVPPLEITPTVSMQTPVCSNADPLAVTVGPDNTGSLSSDNLSEAISSNNGNWNFDPTKLFPDVSDVNKYAAAALTLNGTLTYTINNVNSAPFAVTVYRHPIADFNYKITRTQNPTTVSINLTSISENDETTLQYSWTVTPVKNTPSGSTLPSVVIGTGRKVSLDLIEFLRKEIPQIGITLKVTNQTCNSEVTYGPFDWRRQVNGSSNAGADTAVTSPAETTVIASVIKKKAIATKKTVPKTVKKNTGRKK